MFTELKQFLDSFLDMGVPGFDIMICKDGECIWRYMNGYSDLENRLPVKGDERYNIYSLSKFLTVTAALQLFEKKAYQLDDALYEYMPEFRHMMVRTEDGVREAKNFIRVRDLFTMTAGFNYDKEVPSLQQCRKETNGRCPTRETMKYLAQEPLDFEPSTQWKYSLCHDVLAAFVEVVSGMKFEDYVQKHIFDVLDMKRSTFMLPDNELETLAEQYRFNPELKKPINIGKKNSYKLGTEYASGGAGCISTTEDYIRFLEAMRIGDIVLKKDTIRLMTTDQLTDQTRSTYTQKNFGYGLGVRCALPGSEYTDFGWGGAAAAHVGIDPVMNVSLYYAQHMLASPNQLLRAQIFPILRKALRGEKLGVAADSGSTTLTY